MPVGSLSFEFFRFELHPYAKKRISGQNPRISENRYFEPKLLKMAILSLPRPQIGIYRMGATRSESARIEMILVSIDDPT